MFFAKIDESHCIGCTYCLAACPVDAIVGASQQLHVILESECVGCSLCISPCPVDCISLQPTDKKRYSKEKAIQRHQARQQRLQLQKSTSLQVPSLEERRKEIENLISKKQTN